MTETKDSAAWAEAWPSLPFGEWHTTYATLRLLTQVVGKVRLGPVPSSKFLRVRRTKCLIENLGRIDEQVEASGQE